jgi:hypothetical protein
MYIRFVVGTNREREFTQSGVVAELRVLRESGHLPDYEHEHVEQIFEWLNSHLPSPPFERMNWSPNAISWFKSSSQDMIAKFREIIAILEEHGRPVRMIKTLLPGEILYEDDYQIVAESSRY